MSKIWIFSDRTNKARKVDLSKLDFVGGVNCNPKNMVRHQYGKSPSAWDYVFYAESLSQLEARVNERTLCKIQELQQDIERLQNSLVSLTQKAGK